MVQLSFKFKVDASERDRERVLGRIVQLGAADIEPVIPGATDPDLAAMYTARCNGACDRVEAELTRSGLTEFVQRADSYELID